MENKVKQIIYEVTQVAEHDSNAWIWGEKDGKYNL